MTMLGSASKVSAPKNHSNKDLTLTTFEKTQNMLRENERLPPITQKLTVNNNNAAYKKNGTSNSNAFVNYEPSQIQIDYSI
jgi:hypothetical protein